jgi:hypothetical protein
MTRAQIKKETKRGWLSQRVTLIFLDLDVSGAAHLDDLAKHGIISSRTERGITTYKLADVLAYTDKPLRKLLDKHFPYSRQKKAEHRQRKRLLNTRDKLEEFLRGLFVLQSHLAAWVTFLHVRELKLMTYLLRLVQEHRTFELVVTTSNLEKHTGLDRENIILARNALESRGILSYQRSGTTAWVYLLCDPKTRQALKTTDDGLIIHAANA